MTEDKYDLMDERELRREVRNLLVLIEKISKQKPEKPDYWNSCSQCEHNIEDAKELLGL
jgi:hypothetical protein